MEVIATDNYTLKFYFDINILYFFSLNAYIPDYVCSKIETQETKLKFSFTYSLQITLDECP